MSNNSTGVSVEVQELVTTNYIGIAGLVILLYDHLITFDDEVKYVWCSNKKPMIWLFLINRYLTPLAFGVNINAYTSSAWSDAACGRFVVYEGIMGFVGVAIASLMMAFRVVAVYYGNRYVLALISFLYLAMVGINAWLLTTTGPVIHPGIHGCSMLFGQGNHHIGGWVSATAWTPLIYDTTVVILIVLRTQYIVRAKIAGKVVTVLIRDGLLYFSVIVVVNLVLAVMIVRAADGIKNICAQFQLLMTVTMMSRITLNLRKNMDVSISANSIYTTVGDMHSDIQLDSLAAPPRAILNPPGIERQNGYGYV